MANHALITRRTLAATLAAVIPAAAVAAPPALIEGASEHERFLALYRASVAKFLARAEFMGEEESIAFAHEWKDIHDEAVRTPVKSLRDLRALFKLVQEFNHGCEFPVDGLEMGALYAAIESLVAMEERAA
jgi:hypothetical protein